MHLKYLAYMDGHICFWLILAITCEVEVAVGCVFAHFLDVHAPLACWQCDLIGM